MIPGACRVMKMCIDSLGQLPVENWLGIYTPDLPNLLQKSSLENLLSVVLFKFWLLAHREDLRLGKASAGSFKTGREFIFNRKDIFISIT